MKNLASSCTTQNRRQGSHSLAGITSLLLTVLLMLTAATVSYGAGHYRHSYRHGHRSQWSGDCRSLRDRSPDLDQRSAAGRTTSEAGTYTVTQLQPGAYTVKVEKAGFKAAEQNGITLVIDQVALINIQLTVGSQAESVEVTSTGPVIQTEDSSVGQVIDARPFRTRR